MSYATSRRIEVSEIPVIDIGPLSDDDERATARVGADLRRAAEEVGFLYVKNHGIPEKVIAEADRQARGFFAQPLADKERVRINAYHHGFLRVGEAKMYETARADLKESFVWA